MDHFVYKLVAFEAALFLVLTMIATFRLDQDAAIAFFLWFGATVLYFLIYVTTVEEEDDN